MFFVLLNKQQMQVTLARYQYLSELNNKSRPGPGTFLHVQMLLLLLQSIQENQSFPRFAIVGCWRRWSHHSGAPNPTHLAKRLDRTCHY